MFPGTVRTQSVPPPGELPKPAQGEVVVWWATTDVEAATLESLRSDLDDDTRHRANAFAREEDRRRAVVAHGLLRRVLASMLGGEPRDLHLLRRCTTCGATDHGKPSLPLRDGGSLPPLQFNLAHSGSVVAVAVAHARTPVGVDVELVKPEMNWAATRRHVFTPAEWERSAGADDPTTARFQLWARKESLVKATGDGLSVELAGVNVDSIPEPSQFGPAAIAGQPSGDLRVADLQLAPGTAAAVALAGVANRFIPQPTVVRAVLRRARVGER
jgi:4'-phosphopantetheinyl transferase